jgi:DNA sulfur modification protein DndB
MSFFAYTFPTIRGVQAGRAYYVTMCPLRLIPKIFLFDEEELAPELRAQRTLNRARVPEIARYIVSNPADYVFSSLTASIDADIEFDSLGDGDRRNIGVLRIPLNARIIINDGQHRRAAIEQALREVPELGDETISVVLFVDPGVERSQQMFTDLNRHAVRQPRSLSVLYDHRHDGSVIAREVAKKASCFVGLVEYERSNLARRSTKLFTLSAIETATNTLVSEQAETNEARIAVAVGFWEGVAAHMPDWRLVRERRATSGDVRQDSIAAHGIALSALATAGRSLMREHPDNWRERLAALDGLDWSRANAALWEGRALTGGKVSKSHNSVRLTACVLKKRLGLPLSPDEHELERQKELSK